MEKNAITLLEKHLAIWSERDEQIRNRNIAEVYAPGIEIIDPHFVLNGYSQLNSLIEDLHKKFPDYKFTMKKPVEHHNNVARLYWQLGSESKPDVETGMDVVTIENGLIKTLIVFIDPQE